MLPQSQRRAVFCYIAGVIGGTALEDWHKGHYYIAGLWIVVSLAMYWLYIPPRDSEKPTE